MSADPKSIVVERKIGKAEGLLHSLVPRAQVFCFYDREKNSIWNSDGAEDYEIDNFVADLPSEIITRLVQQDKPLRRTLASGRTVLALPVPGDNDEAAGLLIVLFTKNEGKSSSFNPNLLKTILEPAIELISESIGVSSQVGVVGQRVDDLEEELRFVYEMDEKIHGSSGHHSSLAQLVGRSGRYLGIKYSVLLIPSKRIRISATHSSWKKANRKILDRYIVGQLMPKLEGRRKPVIFEIPAIDGLEGDETGFEILLCPLLDKQGNVEGVLAQLGHWDRSKFSKNNRRFISHIGRKIEYVIERSFDPATGLMSRPGFEAQLRESFGTLKSKSDAHQIIYFDLDNLQLVRDTFGQKAGDDVVLRFARLLDEGLPKTAVLSRLAGNDFCMLLTHASPQAALEYANTISGSASVLRYLDGDKSLQVTVSIGITEFNQKSDDVANALTTVRMACEAAKEAGRDRVEMFDEGNRTIVRRYDDMQLVAKIQQALDGDEFELLAQPIVSLSTNSTSPHYEILLRMDDGDGGCVASSALFSAAERYWMMPQIDRWVISTTIAKLKEVIGCVKSREAVFAINLSGQSIGDDDILEFVGQEIDRSGLPASSFCFEITESAAVSNVKMAQSFIDRLRERGCQVSLDDFGAGLSSFAYLKNFNVDTLKIDGGFIRDITDNRISESMVAAITQVAKVMELKTVAEYVETEAAKTLISELGVDFAQGHYIGRPIPLDSVLSELSDGNTEANSLG